ncbi:hypothetical protein H3143_01930 [Mycoplasma tullyi]|uniref:Lipoprotein n=1 Tax=Mycoplasma tullyi TaxID=1612150 RepID=A0A7D7U8I7_9MOLU|nr:hypothetical protein [Mycoplasma tullyi]QMT98247.1 hypothetical protein H3143_01930 [Mycoplasma tullyi]
MKRKNILKFVSLLGIGSFVVLTAASCTKTSESKPKSPLEAARASLKSLVDTKNKTLEMYSGLVYATLRPTLVSAYASAESVLNDSKSTEQDLKKAEEDLKQVLMIVENAKKTANQVTGGLLNGINGIRG